MVLLLSPLVGKGRREKGCPGTRSTQLVAASMTLLRLPDGRHAAKQSARDASKCVVLGALVQQRKFFAMNKVVARQVKVLEKHL